MAPSREVFVFSTTSSAHTHHRLRYGSLTQGKLGESKEKISHYIILFNRYEQLLHSYLTICNHSSPILCRTQTSVLNYHEIHDYGNSVSLGHIRKAELGIFAEPPIAQSRLHNVLGHSKYQQLRNKNSVSEQLVAVCQQRHLGNPCHCHRRRKTTLSNHNTNLLRQ